MIVHTIKKGDRARKATDTLKIDGAPIDLTGATVYFLMRNIAAGTVIRQAATIVSPSLGTVEYQFAAGETDVVGAYQIEWEIVFAGGLTQTVPSDDYIRLRIMEDLDA